MKKAETTVGSYIASRMQQLGIEHYFAVPGDFNLVLLDQLLTNSQLKLIGCCNELNAGYAADGYARARGIAAVVVTFSVGSLSVINAVAGAYAEDLPVIVLSGGPSTIAAPENRYIHHSLGKVEYNYSMEMFRHVTAESVIVRNLDNAPALIDAAISACVKHRKPVYIEVPCNLAGSPLPQPQPLSFPRSKECDRAALEAAVDAAAQMLNAAVKPVLIAGVKLRPWEATIAFRQLADAAGCAVATMANAKGFFPESHPAYIGTYWGPVSSPGCAEVVESADVYLFAGPLFSDYTTTGYTSLINNNKLINVGPDRVTMPGGAYNGVALPEFLTALALKVRPNDASLKSFDRFRRTEPSSPSSPDKKLFTARLWTHIQQMLGPDSIVLTETGDSWFNGMKLRLPEGAKFEIQMQYGSIGWSVGATLGLALGAESSRVIAAIGDGSFQLSAQEVSTMIRYELRPIIFLINNRGYTIEVEIHDGPYNNIKNWDYAGLMNVFNAENGNGWGTRVETEEELAAAIDKAIAHNGPSLIECIIDRDDCSKELLEWGVRVSAFNSQ